MVASKSTPQWTTINTRETARILDRRRIGQHLYMWCLSLKAFFFCFFGPYGAESPPVFFWVKEVGLVQELQNGCATCSSVRCPGALAFGEAPLDLPLPFLAGVKACGFKVALGCPLSRCCRAWRCWHGWLGYFGRNCRRLRASFLMCVSSYKVSSRDHCCPRRSDMAAQSLRSADRSSWAFTVRRPRFGSRRCLMLGNQLTSFRFPRQLYGPTKPNQCLQMGHRA